MKRHYFSWSIAIFILLMLGACKKDKSSGSVSGSNSDNQDSLSFIIHRTFNLTLEWEQANQFNHVTIDIDDDGIAETALYLISEYGSILDIAYDNIYVQTYCPESSSKIYFANHTESSPSGDYVLTSSIPASEWIQAETGESFETDMTVLSAKINDQNGGLQYTIGDFYGGGDSYIAFQIQIDDAYHFGWLRVNLSPDLKTLQIIDAAYQNLPDEHIQAGAH